MGNLSGIVDASLGLNLSKIYGFYSDSVYLKGNLVLGGTNSIALQDNTVAMGNVTGTANSAIKVANTGTAATSGIWGYDMAGNTTFSLALNNKASIAGWMFDKDII